MSIVAPVGVSYGSYNTGGCAFLRVGLMVQANFFYHATYNNIDRRGFYLGWGPYSMMASKASPDAAKAWTNWTFRGGMKRQGHVVGWQYGIMYAPGDLLVGFDGNVRQFSMFQWEISIIMGYGK